MLGRHLNLDMWILLWLVWASHESSDQKFMLACADQELFTRLAPLQFSCSDKILGGYYADVESSCHVFHFCGPGYKGGVADYVFCCHPDLVFDQKFLVCDRPDTVVCDRSVFYYSLQFRDVRSVTELGYERSEKATSTTAQRTGNYGSDVEQSTRINSSVPTVTKSLKLVNLLDIGDPKIITSSNITVTTEVLSKKLANILTAVDTSETTTVLSKVQTIRHNSGKRDSQWPRTLAITFNIETTSFEPVTSLSKYTESV
ncbi:uncharacterized protein LOC143247275 [Tachypleus tridentatus]|uniref:uncharacterized protein LOC143247275 n=1 Tax=Tachypleus tridentatus TaxID=6853 RepID=UPI003FD092D7